MFCTSLASSKPSSLSAFRPPWWWISLEGLPPFKRRNPVRGPLNPCNLPEMQPAHEHEHTDGALKPYHSTHLNKQAVNMKRGKYTLIRNTSICTTHHRPLESKIVHIRYLRFNRGRKSQHLNPTGYLMDSATVFTTDLKWHVCLPLTFCFRTFSFDWLSLGRVSQGASPNICAVSLNSNL